MRQYPGSKARLREYFIKHVGKVLDSDQLYEASGGAKEFGRRIRELRNQEGWNIQTHKDRVDLHPGQYILVNLEKLPAFERNISKETRAVVLERNGYTCQMCGVSQGEIHPFDGRKAQLHIGHIIDKSMGGTDEPANLRALCSVCNEGASNVVVAPPAARKLKAQVNKCARKDQITILKWLISKYVDVARELISETDD